MRQVSSEYNSVTHRLVKKHDRLFLMLTLAPGRPMVHPGTLFGGISANSVEIRGQRERGSGA